MHIVSALVAAAAFVAVDAVVPEHKIASLPGYADDISFDQYAGHLSLPSNGQKMFYWLVESEESPSTAPLVLWLNGGPGCSSLGGFFTELGPFVVNSDLSVQRNPYAWNRKANMVFLESPAGVGFSTPLLNATDYNDDFTANRTYEFLEQFFAAYPSYHGRDFYITGESYAGIYIPYLAAKLVMSPLPSMTFKGVAIGNAYTDVAVEAPAFFEYMYSRALISYETHASIQKHCGEEGIVGCITGNKTTCTNACAQPLVEGYLESDSFAMDPYYIYGDVCQLSSSQASLLPSPSLRPMHRGVIGPCQAQYTASYLRQAAVQVAIHASDDVVEWTDCSGDVSMAYHSSPSSLPKYPTILQSGLKVLIYSGDADTVVNFMGTQRWLTQGLNLSVESKWKAWFGPDKQLAGYTEGYTNLTFTTIKGAGHMVPAMRPLHGLYMFECFLFGNDVCKAFSYPVDDFELLTGAAVTKQDDVTTTSSASTSATSSPAILWIGGIVGGLFVVGGITLYAYKRTARRAEYTHLTA